MIFVTVGTHEQPFNRLIIYMDTWAKTHNEKVMIQTGYCTYQPQNCVWEKMYSYTEMLRNIKSSRIVITHGGPSSFITPIQMGKIPVVVPRRYEYNEHVNNHQMRFCKRVADKTGNILVVEEIDELSYIIEHYDKLISDIDNKNTSNNQAFCANFEAIVNAMFSNKK